MIVRHRFPTPTVERNLDRAFEQLTNSFFETRRPGGPLLDGAWRGDEYVLTVDLPGVPASAVSVDVTGDTLALEAQTDSMQWQRTLRLGGRLDPDQIVAHHVDGRLTVRIGTYAPPEARRVAISTTAPPTAINSEALGDSEAHSPVTEVTDDDAATPEARTPKRRPSDLSRSPAQSMATSSAGSLSNPAISTIART